MATLASDLVAATKRHLLSGVREELDILAANITTTSASSFTDTDAANGIQTGAYVEIDTELMYVRSISGTTVNVLRGQGGSTAATHSSGAVVTVNPRFPAHAVLAELNNELAALSSPTNGLYKIVTLDLTWSNRMGYDLTSSTDVLDLLDVAWKDYGSLSNWVDVAPARYQLQRNMATSEFASGNAVIFQSGVVEPGRTVRVRYKAPFSALSLLTDDVQSVAGLPATANDIPPMGAAARLAGPGEVRRTFVEGQGDPRADGDVPVGSRLNAASWLLARREKRIGEEAARLARRFPVARARY